MVGWSSWSVVLKNLIGAALVRNLLLHVSIIEILESILIRISPMLNFGWAHTNLARRMLGIQKIWHWRNGLKETLVYLEKLFWTSGVPISPFSSRFVWSVFKIKNFDIKMFSQSLNSLDLFRNWDWECTYSIISISWFVQLIVLTFF